MQQALSHLATKGVPSAHSPEWGRACLLMSYSSDLVDGFRQTGGYRENPEIGPNASWHRVTILSFSSAAAFSVNVKAIIFRGANTGSVSRLRRCTTRRATTSVFPDPAHAMSCKFFPPCEIAFFC